MYIKLMYFISILPMLISFSSCSNVFSGVRAVNLQGHFLAATPFPVLQIAPPETRQRGSHQHVENGWWMALKVIANHQSISMTRPTFCILSKTSSIISGLECVTAWCTACPTWAATLPTDMLRSWSESWHRQFGLKYFGWCHRVFFMLDLAW